MSISWFEFMQTVFIHWFPRTHREKKNLPPPEGGRCHVAYSSSQSGVSAHCDPVQRGCFIKGLVVINERVELSTVPKLLHDGLTFSTTGSSTLIIPYENNLYLYNTAIL